jgi:hypothetical protein
MKRKAIGERNVIEFATELRRLVRDFCTERGGKELKPDSVNQIIGRTIGGEWALETPCGRWHVCLPSDPITSYVAIKTHFDNAKRAESTGLTTATGRWDFGVTVNPTVDALAQATQFYAAWLELVVTRRVFGAPPKVETKGGAA